MLPSPSAACVIKHCVPIRFIAPIEMFFFQNSRSRFPSDTPQCNTWVGPSKHGLPGLVGPSEHAHASAAIDINMD